MGQHERDIDVTRRDLGALLGVLGGAAGLSALSSCVAKGGENSGLESTAHISEALVSGTDIKWVDTVLGAAPPNTRTGDLATSTGGTSGTLGATVAIALGCVQPGDGGGGLFYWSTSNIVDDGGTKIVPNGTGGDAGDGGASGPGWVRIYCGALNVKWFGTIGNGTADDGAAIQNAINAAQLLAGTYTLTEDAGGGDAGGLGFTVGSTPAVDLGTGIYALTCTLTVQDQHLSVFSDSGAVLKQTTSAQILSFTGAYQNQVRGLRFTGGTNHIAITQTAYLDATMIGIINCEFQQSTGYAVLTIPPSGNYDIDGTLMIEDCKFIDCGGVLANVCDEAIVQNTVVRWIAVPSGAPLSMFQNMTSTTPVGTGGTLHLRSMIGECAVEYNASSCPARWIDNYAGHVWVSNCRFPADSYTGVPVVFHWQELGQVSPGMTGGSTIVIRDSNVYNSSAAIYIAAGCPQRIVLEGIDGLLPYGTNSVIDVYGSYNLGAYLDGLPTSGWNPFPFIKVTVDSDLQAMTLGGVCNPLIQFMNPFESSAFKMGAQPGVSLSPSQPTRASCTYPIPSSLAGFLGVMTVSMGPGAFGYTYRGVASFLVSLTTGYNGDAATDYLAWTPLSVVAGSTPEPWPTTPGVASISISMNFGSSPQTGSSLALSPATQAHGAAANFTVTWDSNTTGGNQAIYPTITFQPFHHIT